MMELNIHLMVLLKSLVLLPSDLILKHFMRDLVPLALVEAQIQSSTLQIILVSEQLRYLDLLRKQKHQQHILELELVSSQLSLDLPKLLVGIHQTEQLILLFLVLVRRDLALYKLIVELEPSVLVELQVQYSLIQHTLDRAQLMLVALQLPTMFQTILALERYLQLLVPQKHMVQNHQLFLLTLLLLVLDPKHMLLLDIQVLEQSLLVVLALEFPIHTELHSYSLPSYNTINIKK